jgi:hypothetical protein
LLRVDATKVTVGWSSEAPLTIGGLLRDPAVTSLRITAPARDDDAVDWDEENWDADPAPPDGIGDIASLDLSRIVDLDVSYLRLGPLGAEALAVASFVHLDPAEERIGAGRVETLDLRYCYIGDAGLAAIAASSTFRNVRRLHLQANRIGATGVAALAAFPRLEVLDLRYNDLGAAGVEALLATPFIGRLARMNLYRTDVGDAGAKLLAHAPQLPPALRSLWRSV